MEKETVKQATERQRKEAIEFLSELLTKGTTVYTNVMHVSRSGMMRRISVYAAVLRNNEPEILNISGYVAHALEYPRDFRDGGLVVKGGGMDMGYHIVNSLSYALHGMGNLSGQGYERSGYTLAHRSL